MDEREQASLFQNSAHESASIERKFCENGNLPKDLWETITAFSNSNEGGGTLQLGIEDDGKFAKLNSSETDKIQKDLISQCKSQYNHEVTPSVAVYEGWVSARIPALAASLKPLYSTSRGFPKGARIRIGSTNAQIDTAMIRKFALEAEGGAEMQELPQDPEKVTDPIHIKTYTETLNETGTGAKFDPEDPSIKEKLRIVSHDNKLTFFGMLAFGDSNLVQAYLGPTIEVVVTQYSGKEKVDSQDVQVPFIDNRHFGGPILDQFHQAFAFLLQKLPVKGVIGPSGIRQDYLAIPEVAIREALANALSHRDYSDKSSRIQIDIYSDRIEFINPGISLAPIESLMTTPPIARNANIGNFLRVMGVTEQKGRGIKTIFASLKEAGLKEPIFENRHNCFAATIFSSAFITAEDQKWLSSLDSRLTERQKKALLHLKNNKEGLSNAEYRTINNMDSVGDDVRAQRELKKLVKMSYVITSGENKHRRYHIAP